MILSATKICVIPACNAVFLDIIHDLVKVTECKSHITVCGTVVDCDLPAFRVVNGRTRESNVRNKASFLIPLFRSKEPVFATVKHL